MIEIENLSFTYSDGTQALKNINITIPQEHIFVLMGLSGSGKTTLLNCIARFLKPQKGLVLFENKNIYEMSEKSFRKNIGVVFQHLNLFPHLTVFENLTLAPIRVQNQDVNEVKSYANDMLERLGIADLSESFPSQISGGQAQRVAIARGLMLQPKVMLLDEPTSALDFNTTDEFSEWLRELQSDTSFIIVTHDLPFAQKTAEKGVFMSDGQVKEYGKINTILEHIERS